MTTRQKFIGIALLGFLLFIVFGRDAHGREVTLNSGSKWNLDRKEEQILFREHYKNDLRARACIERADYAVGFMHERNAGTTEEVHLEIMRENYERTRGKPQGVVSHYVYVDFQRMVRDIHRRHGSRFSFTNPNVIWEREIWWCVF